MYAERGPEKDIFRGVVSQSPLIKLVEPPPGFLLFLLSILSKVIPNFRLHNPVLVLSVNFTSLIVGEKYLSGS
jgi:hypothetical protein